MRYLPIFFLLTACDLLVPTPPLTPPTPTTVTLTASVTEGDIPLAVTFTAAATPAAETFRWSIGGELQAETKGTLSTTFTTPGLYVVSVSVNGVSAAGASDSVTVTVGGTPEAEPGPTELTLSQTPGGPAPWGVAYTVAPAVDGIQARCSERAAYTRVQAGRFNCLHVPGDTAEVRFVDAAGVVGARAEASPDVTENSGVAFAGRWRYRARGVSETFAISEGGPRAGRSADGRFQLFTIRQNGLTVAEFTLDGRTVVLEPTPGPDGRQVFTSPFGLTLEPLADDPEEGGE